MPNLNAYPPIKIEASSFKRVEIYCSSDLIELKRRRSGDDLRKRPYRLSELSFELFVRQLQESVLEFDPRCECITFFNSAMKRRILVNDPLIWYKCIVHYAKMIWPISPIEFEIRKRRTATIPDEDIAFDIPPEAKSFYNCIGTKVLEEIWAHRRRLACCTVISMTLGDSTTHIFTLLFLLHHLSLNFHFLNVM